MMTLGRIACLSVLFYIYIPLVQAQDSAKHYESARAAYSMGKPDEAWIHIKNTLQIDPEHLPAKILLSQLYFNDGNLAAVEDELFEALALGADINLVLPLLGSALVIQKKVDLLFSLEKYLSQIRPENMFEWEMLKGQAYLVDGENEFALRQFKSALELKPNEVRVLNTIANIYVRNTWYEEANNLIQQSLDIESDNHKTWTLKGDLHIAQEDFKQALSSYDYAYLLAPKDVSVLRTLAALHLRKNEMEKVEKYATELQSISPQDPSSLLMLAWTKISHNELDSARESLANLSAKLGLISSDVNDQNPVMLYIRGAAEFIQGRDLTALAILTDYIALVPNDVGALQILTELHVRNKNYKAALQLLSPKVDLISANLPLSLKLLTLQLQLNQTHSALVLVDKLNLIYPDHPSLIFAESHIEKARGTPGKALEVLEKLPYASQEPLSVKLFKGNLYLDEGDLNKAFIVKQEIEALGVETVEVNNFFTLLSIYNNNLSDAQKYIEKTLSLEGENTNALYNKAIILKTQGKIDEAVETVNQILAIEKNHFAAINMLAKIEFVRGNIAEAEQLVNKILQELPEDTRALETLTDIRVAQGLLKDAIRIVNKLNRIERLNPTFIEKRISIYLKLLDFDAAEKDLKILAGLWVDDVQKLITLSQLQYKGKLSNEAIKSLRRATELDNKHFQSHMLLAEMYLLTNQKEHAQKLSETIKKQFGNSYHVAILFGDIADAMGDSNGALTAFEEALAFDSDGKLAIVKLYQMAKKGLGGEEFTLMLESMLSEHDSGWKRKLLADSYLDQKKYKEAEKQYLLLSESPGLKVDPAVLNNLANIQAMTNLVLAESTARRALDMEKTNPNILDTLGWILAKKGRHEEALTYLRRAFSMNSSSGEIRYHIGYVLLKLGRKVEAIKELEYAVKAVTGYPELDDAKVLLESIR